MRSSADDDDNFAERLTDENHGIFVLCLVVTLLLLPLQLCVMYKTLKTKMHLLSILIGMILVPTVGTVLCNLLVYEYVSQPSSKGLLVLASILAGLDYGCLALVHWLFAMRYHSLSIKLKCQRENDHDNYTQYLYNARILNHSGCSFIGVLSLLITLFSNWQFNGPQYLRGFSWVLLLFSFVFNVTTLVLIKALL